MKEIRLSKPLYKEDEPAGSPVPKQAAPPESRPPRASMLGRGGALLVDLLLLHGICSAIVKFAGDQVVVLGWGGPWIGVVLALVYFGLSASPLAQGRTIGKFILRLRACDVAGPDLPVGRALKRAALLVAPLAVYVATLQYADSIRRPDEISPLGSLPLVGVALAVGWYLGNAFFAGSEPFGRTLYDRLSGSIVVNSDAGIEPIAEWLRGARTCDKDGIPRRALIMLLMPLLGFPAITGYLLFQQARAMKALPEEERAFYMKMRAELDIPGFSDPQQVPQPRPKPESADQPTTVAHFQYLKRGRIDVQKLQTDSRATSAVDRMIGVQRRLLSDARAKNRLSEAKVPREIEFCVSFAEFADLLFARNALEVFSVRRVADFSEFQTTGTATITSTTAVSRETTTSLQASATTATETGTTATQ